MNTLERTANDLCNSLGCTKDSGIAVAGANVNNYIKKCTSEELQGIRAGIVTKVNNLKFWELSENIGHAREAIDRQIDVAASIQMLIDVQMLRRQIQPS